MSSRARTEPKSACPSLRRLLCEARDVGLRQTMVDGLPKAAHFLGGAARWIELGHAPAAARCVLVLDPGKDQRGDQPTHFFERLGAVLDPRGLLGGRALIEQEYELGPDLLERRARSSAGPQIEQAGAGRNDIQSAACIAAVDAAPSAPGVSRSASVTPRRSREAIKAGSRAAPEARTSMSPAARILAQFMSEPCGSMSMTQTFSFVSCAATARDETIVLLPDPLF